MFTIRTLLPSLFALTTLLACGSGDEADTGSRAVDDQTVDPTPPPVEQPTKHMIAGFSLLNINSGVEFTIEHLTHQFSTNFGSDCNVGIPFFDPTSRLNATSSLVIHLRVNNIESTGEIEGIPVLKSCEDYLQQGVGLFLQKEAKHDETDQPVCDLAQMFRVKPSSVSPITLHFGDGSVSYTFTYTTSSEMSDESLEQHLEKFFAETSKKG